MAQKQLWYVTKNGQQLGPYSSRQLKELANSGQLEPNDLIWTEGLQEWILARTIKQLFPEKPAAPPLASVPPVVGTSQRQGASSPLAAAPHPVSPDHEPSTTQPTTADGRKVDTDAAQQDTTTSPRKDQRLASWIFGSLLLLFFVGVFLFAPPELPAFKQRMLGVSCALLAGIFAFFMTGTINLELKIVKAVLGEVGVKATGGVAIFALVLWWWLSPLAPVAIDEKLAEIKDDTTTIRSHTTDIKKGVEGLGRLGGLKAKPESALDFWHNFQVYSRDGDIPNALQAIDRYFEMEAAEYYDPYQDYRNTLLRKYDQGETATMLQQLADRKPKSQAARLVLLEHSGQNLAKQLQQFVAQFPDFLPAYYSLFKAMPNDTVLEERERSLVQVEFQKRGGYKKVKGFYLNPKHDDLTLLRDFGLAEPLDPREHFKVSPLNDASFDGLRFAFTDKRAGQELILTFPMDIVAALPLSPGGVAIVELRRGEGGHVEFKKRRSDDVRIYKHCGYLSGLKKGATLVFSVEYVDAKGNRYKFPKPMSIGVTRFQAEVIHGTAAIRMGIARPPQLQITCGGEYLRSCEVATQEKGPYLNVPRHMNVPTMFEVQLSRVPGLDGKPGPNTFWIKGVTDSGEALGPEAVTIICPEGLGDLRGAMNEAKGRLVATLEEHKGLVDAVAYSPDSKFLASGGHSDNMVILWDTAKNQVVEKFQVAGGGGSRITSLAFTPDSKTLAVGDAGEGMLLLWDVQARKQRIIKGQDRDFFPSSLAFSPDGKLLASAGYRRGLIALWETESGASKGTLSGHKLYPRGLAFSADGSRLASCAMGNAGDQSVKLWELSTGKVVTNFIGHWHQVNKVVFARDDQVLVSCSSDKTVRFWDISSGKLLRQADEHEEMVFALAVSRDGNILASGDADGTVKLWDAKSGKVQASFPTDKGAVYDIAFSPNGQTLATSGRAVKLWNVAVSK
jgi:DNA-binding beta-propeller fold protein YncE